ncbi:MAG TPA: alcohol dehydrogenase [bacterium]|nr:alcohol dehydrogenase [bacterium]
MKAMILNQTGSLARQPRPLIQADLPDPEPGPGEILIRISACGVCHTELDEIEGRTPPSRFPMIPGHEIIGRIAKAGRRSKRFKTGDRVGVGWIYSACGQCEYCRTNRENLCPEFRATGRDAFGGYAQLMTVGENFAVPIPDIFSDAEAAPLMCAGAIGYRSLMLTGLVNGRRLGLTGFGASAHLVLKLTRHLYPDSPVAVFARSPREREFALELGAVWAGDTADIFPGGCDAVIDTTPVWKPVFEAMKNLRPGGRLVINAIRKEDHDREVMAALDYPSQLWMEKEIKSVANVTREDIRGFLKTAAEIPIKPEVEIFPLEEANEVLHALKAGHLRGAKVLSMD